MKKTKIISIIDKKYLENLDTVEIFLKKNNIEYNLSKINLSSYKLTFEMENNSNDKFGVVQFDKIYEDVVEYEKGVG